MGLNNILLLTLAFVLYIRNISTTYHTQYNKNRKKDHRYNRKPLVSLGGFSIALIYPFGDFICDYSLYFFLVHFSMINRILG